MEEIIDVMLHDMANGIGMWHTEDCWTKSNTGCGGEMEVQTFDDSGHMRQGPPLEVDGTPVETFQDYIVLKCDTCGSVRLQRDGRPYYMHDTGDGWQSIRFHPSDTSE
mgnify:CR=1 FL=1